MKFILEINIDNAAFEDEPLGEISRILRDQATNMVHWVGDGSKSWDATLRDINGNTVGKAYLDKRETL